MENSQIKTVKRILKEIAGYRGHIVLSLICAMLTVFFTLQIPIFIGKFVDCIISAGNVDVVEMRRISIKMFLMIATTFVTQYVMNIINNKMTYQISFEMRKRAFDRLQEIQISAIDNHAKGDYVSRIVNDVDGFTDGLLMGFTQLFTGVLTVLGTIFFMFRISIKISIIVVIFTPLSILFARFISKKTYKHFRKQAMIRGEQTSYMEEIIRNENIVHAFNYTKRATEKFKDLNNSLAKSSLKATFYSSIVHPSTRLINNIIYASVGILGAFIVISGGMTVGGLTSFLSYASTYAKPFNEITGVVTEFSNAIACATRLYEIEDMRPQENRGSYSLENVQGKIEFKNVSFSYDKDKKLIENFNLKVNPGDRVAIVGPTGAGKSTLINLIMRFYEVDEGQILIDGIDIKDITLSSLRTNIGMVLQDSWIKEDTVKNNLIINNPEISVEEMEENAKKSHVHNFIKRMKHGYNTVVSTKNSLLSAGQLQLLCIARVMMKLPPILILDEATSNIDTRTEQKIQSIFNKMMKGRTTFIVAHRLSTIKEADVILFLKDGKVVEQGTHAFLLQKGGFYAKLYQCQFKED